LSLWGQISIQSKSQRAHFSKAKGSEQSPKPNSQSQVSEAWSFQYSQSPKEPIFQKAKANEQDPKPKSQSQISEA